MLPESRSLIAFRLGLKRRSRFPVDLKTHRLYLAYRRIHMKYMCFGYYDTIQFSNLTPAAIEAIPDACKPHDDALNASGKKVFLGCLTEPETWRSIRPGDEKPAITEGAFQANREQVGVFFIIEAETIDEAVQIASLHPSAHLGKYFGGGIEVCPCELFEVYSS